MTHEENRVRKIEMLRRWERKHYKHGVLLLNGDVGLFYFYANGAIKRASLDSSGKLKYYGENLGRLKNGYLVFRLSGSSINVYNHIVAGVALGLFDNVDIRRVQINHKNYNGIDNRPENLEICSVSENCLHRRFREICIKLGVWREGMSIEAKKAAFILKSSKGYEHKLMRDVIGM